MLGEDSKDGMEERCRNRNRDRAHQNFLPGYSESGREDSLIFTPAPPASPAPLDDRRMSEAGAGARFPPQPLAVDLTRVCGGPSPLAS